MAGVWGTAQEPLPGSRPPCSDLETPCPPRGHPGHPTAGMLRGQGPREVPTKPAAVTPQHHVGVGTLGRSQGGKWPRWSGIPPEPRRDSAGKVVPSPTHPSSPVGTHLPGSWVSHLEQVKPPAPAPPSLSCYEGKRDTAWWRGCWGGNGQALLDGKHLPSCSSCPSCAAQGPRLPAQPSAADAQCR